MHDGGRRLVDLSHVVETGIVGADAGTGAPGYFEGHPFLTRAAAEWLVEARVALVGEAAGRGFPGSRGAGENPGLQLVPRAGLRHRGIVLQRLPAI